MTRATLAALALACLVPGPVRAGGPKPGEPMAGSLAAAAFAIQKVADSEALVPTRIAVHRSADPVLADVEVEADAPFWKLAALVGMADGPTNFTRLPAGRRIAFQVRLEPPTGPAPADPAPHAPVTDWVAFTDQKGLSGRCLRFREGPGGGPWQVTVEADAPPDLALEVCRRASAKVGEARLTGIELLRPGSPQARLVLSGYSGSMRGPAVRSGPREAARPAVSPAADPAVPPAPAPAQEVPAPWSEAGSWLQGPLPASRLEILEQPDGRLRIQR